MSLENWVKNSWLERHDSDAAEIARLLGLADGRLEDYQRAVAGKLSSDVQLGLAYDAIRISATAALRAAGYRVVRGGVLVQSEMEKKFFPLVKIPPLRGGDFQGRRIHRPMPVSHGFASAR